MILSTHRLSSTTLRSYSGEVNHSLENDFQYFKQQIIPIRTPHLAIFTEEPEIKDCCLRARADAIGLRHKFSNANIFSTYEPKNRISALLYDWFEQIRVQAICPDEFEGSKKNLDRQFFYWSDYSYTNGYLENHTLLLLFTVVQVVYSHLLNKPVYEPDEGVLEATRGGIAPLLGHSLIKLKKYKEQQQLFAVEAKKIAKKITKLIKKEFAQTQFQKNSTDKPQEKTLNRWLLNELEENFDIPNQDNLLSAQSNYTIFNRQYDVQKHIKDLVRKNQRLQFFKQNQKYNNQEKFLVNINWFANRLKNKFSNIRHQPKNDREEGYIDGNKLVPLVLEKKSNDVFINQQITLQVLGHLTLLLDCSGSMRQYNLWLQQFLKLLTLSCEQIGLPFSILAYTTNAWNGGRVLSQWQKIKKTSLLQYPGRLNELLHIEVKNIHTYWHIAKYHIAGLLKADIYRENIDGEAIEWAFNYITQQNQQGQKKLIVISDGNPSDSASLQNNPASLLIDNLYQTLLSKPAQTIKTIGIGLNKDLPACYKWQMQLDTNKPLTNSSIMPLINIL